MLELRNITKRFGNVLANDHVNIVVKPGTIHAIVGENGAGKSTAMRIVYGFYTADSGEILIAPQSPEGTTPTHADRTVRGWLLFFCVVLTIISPLSTLYNLGSGYVATRAVVARFPGLGIWLTIDGLLSVGLMAFGIFAGVLLWTRRPTAVTIAKTFLGALMGYAVVSLFLPLAASVPTEIISTVVGAAFIQFIRTAVFVSIWSLYLSSSKRVRLIYGTRQSSQIRTPLDAIARGIGMVHQHFMLVDTMTVAENIVLGAEPGSVLALDIAKASVEIRRLSEEFKLAVNPNAVIERLSVGQQQRVEILKALYRHARLLILDEPTAVLTPQEVDEFFSILRRMREQGKTVVIITHKLAEVLAISDEVTVMRDGRVVGQVQTKETNAAELARMMVGREVLLRVEKPDAVPGNAELKVRNLSVAGREGKAVDDVSFEVRKGEIVGIAGVEGNGQTELIEALAGLVEPSRLSGEIKLEDQDITREGARIRRELGIAHIPEDRHRRGLLLEFDLAENSILGVHYRKPIVAYAGFLDHEAIRTRANEIIEGFDVRPANPDLPARALSGGNQQKLIIGREFKVEPKLLLVSQPTRGVDIGAIEFIHRKLVELRDSGCAVLLVSAELEEVTSLADRLLIIHDGHIVGEVDPKVATIEEIGLLMTRGH